MAAKDHRQCKQAEERGEKEARQTKIKKKHFSSSCSSLFCAVSMGLDDILDEVDANDSQHLGQWVATNDMNYQSEEERKKQQVIISRFINGLNMTAADISDIRTTGKRCYFTVPSHINTAVMIRSVNGAIEKDMGEQGTRVSIPLYYDKSRVYVLLRDYTFIVPVVLILLSLLFFASFPSQFGVLMQEVLFVVQNIFGLTK